jgi:1-aminocyclopropane-1-carboxylate deaminase/D-cysteine desulfhydrase-like pyridoxal-dependent ACC family enzyme
MDNLKAWTEISPNTQFIPKTRIHPLIYSNFPTGKIWIKREDESSFGIPGPKLRKYASLLPNLLHRKIKSTLLIGGAYSNNLAALPQLLTENNIQSKLLIRGENTLKTTGNLFLIKVLNAAENLHWIPRSDWHLVMTIAQELQDQLPEVWKHSFIIPEGAFIPESLLGSMTLGKDIRRNEQENSVEFNHILIDSGTGLSAMAAILDDYAFRPDRKWHILLSAGTKEEFLSRFSTAWKWHQATSPNYTKIPDNYILYEPNGIYRFGKTNEALLSATLRIAREHGILTDPIYGTKLWLFMESLLENNALPGNSLLIHSGGSSILGFQEQLNRISG